MGNDQRDFLCQIDLGQEVPANWRDALDLLKDNYANSLVIKAAADVFCKDIMIVTVHGVSFEL